MQAGDWQWVPPRSVAGEALAVGSRHQQTGPALPAVEVPRRDWRQEWQHHPPMAAVASCPQRRGPVLPVVEVPRRQCLMVAVA